MEENRKYGGFRDLKVYQLAYKLAMEIFKETKYFIVARVFETVEPLLSEGGGSAGYRSVRSRGQETAKVQP